MILSLILERIMYKEKRTNGGDEIKIRKHLLDVDHCFHLRLFPKFRCVFISTLSVHPQRHVESHMFTHARRHVHARVHTCKISSKSGWLPVPTPLLNMESRVPKNNFVVATPIPSAFLFYHVLY